MFVWLAVASLLKSSFFKTAFLCGVTDFAGVEAQKRESLDDIMLSAILIRVNYKAVTRTINVKDCKHIRGICLAPLRGSQVLEILDVEDSFLTKNRLGLRFANFANHVSL